MSASALGLLAFEGVDNGVLQRLSIEQYFAVATFGPGPFADQRLLLLSQSGSTVGLQLVPDRLRSYVGHNHNVNVIGPSGHRMKLPAAMCTMFAAGQFNRRAVFWRKIDRIELHFLVRFGFQFGIRWLIAFMFRSPTPRISGKPGAIRCPCDKNTKSMLHIARPEPEALLAEYLHWFRGWF